MEHRGGLAARLESIASEAGLAGFGICAADPFPEVREEIERRVADGSHGGLGFTYARPQVATDLRSSFPWAVSLVVGVASYLPAAGNPGPARPATGQSRMEGSRLQRLDQLAESLHPSLRRKHIHEVKAV